MTAHTLIADKAYEADERVMTPLRKAGKPFSSHQNQQDEQTEFR